MTRPARASTARKLVRSPEPRRPLLWSIEERIRTSCSRADELDGGKP